MAKNTIKLTAKNKGDITEVKTIIKHIMETGLRTDKKTGKTIPAHFITELTCMHNGKLVFSADWGAAVAKNPYLFFKFSGANVGDEIKISWLDNTSDSDTRTTHII